jgi:transcriptional regulator with XRE-family HTH domain
MAVGDELKGEIESRWRELGEFIREQRNLGELSLRKLSEQAGVSNPYLSQIERGLRKPSAEVLRRVARALEISSEELYVRAGILDEREEHLDLGAAIRREPDLTEDQKKIMIQLYESFVGGRKRAGDVDDEAAAEG